MSAARKRTPTGISGILAIDKPAGMTSHDVVAAVRRVTGEQRIGHTGTLDPSATGLLLACIGPATRLSDYLMAGTKTYEARICFGKSTTTDDGEGEEILTAELPPQLEDSEFATGFLKGLIGEVMQVPPAFSAIKKNGVTSYKAARKGEALELKPRPVQLSDIMLVAAGHDYWDIRLTVSKGFYVRALARDLGRQLGSAAYLGALNRTALGQVSLEQASRLSSLIDDASSGQLPFINAVVALGFPAVEIDFGEARRVQYGRTLTLPAARHALGVGEVGSLVSVVYHKRLLALYEMDDTNSLAHPKVVIPGGVCLAPENRMIEDPRDS